MSQGIRHAPLITFFVEIHTLNINKVLISSYFQLRPVIITGALVLFEFHSTVSCVNMSKISLHYILTDMRSTRKP